MVLANAGTLNGLASDVRRKWNRRGKESRKVLINVLQGCWRRRAAREGKEGQEEDWQGVKTEGKREFLKKRLGERRGW